MATQYLRIANRGETQVEAFTVLGASSARGEADKIGQFGSGAKHAVLCALRAGLSLIVYCGREKIVPQTQPQTIHGRVQERVCFRIGARLEQSSMTLDFGSIDWKQPVDMMLRELVSNALDSSGGDWSNVVIEYVDKPRAKAGWTSVYVEVSQQVREYVSNLHHRFLHVNGDQDKTLLAQNPGPCKFFRKGVFVHQVESSSSLYSYNCGDELPIDESRNLDSHRVRQYAAQIVCCDPKVVRHIVRLCCETTDEFYERSFSYYSLTDSVVADALRELYGTDVCVADNPVTLSRAQSKGLNVKYMGGCEGWIAAAKAGGIPDAVSLLSNADAQGFDVFDASEQLQSNVDYVWSMLRRHNLTGKLACPPCHEFEKPMNHGAQLNGFYDPSTLAIYLHRDCVDSYAIILEELSHYITAAADETRDLQDFAFRFAGLLLMEGPQ